MQRKHHMWLMIVNGLLFFVNGLFISSGLTDINFIAALISLFGFSCAYYNWLKHEDE